VVNKNLGAYYDAWDRFIESWIVIKIKEPNCVFQWRLQVIIKFIQLVASQYAQETVNWNILTLLFCLQAEVAMRADGKAGMSDEEVCFSYS
jgi:D-glycerate 3-kinase